jgi:hypothetical protein
MTLSETIFWSLSRSVLIASLAVGPSAIVIRGIHSERSTASRRLLLMLAMIPFFVPELLIGFHYRLTATQLSSGASPLLASVCTELLYSMLQFARCVSVGVAVSLVFPRNEVSAPAQYSWILLRKIVPIWQWRSGWMKLQLAGPWTSHLVAWSVMALMTFQEFETAARMQIDRHPVAWSVWLFDAHAARQPLSDSLRMVLRPALCELLLLTPLFSLIIQRRFRSAGHVDSADLDSMEFECRKINVRQHDLKRSWRKLSGFVWLIPGVSLLLIWPLITNSRSATAGLWDMLTQGGALAQSLRQMLTSTVFAVTATVVAVNIAITLVRSWSVRSHGTVIVIIAFVLPGLMGSLVVSLLLLALFQIPMLRWSYDTWLPMLLGQVLVVLPKTVAVVILLMQAADSWAQHSAKLLLKSDDVRVRTSASQLLWRMTDGRWLIGCLLITHWCFWDLTVASILRPVQFEPVVTRLYNEMHYGRTEALMSLAVLAAFSPVFVWLLAMTVSFLWSDRLRKLRSL